MIQTTTLANQPVEGIQVAHRALRTEIEIGILDRWQFARRDIIATHRHISRRIDLQAVASNRRGCKFAREIEHRRRRDIDRRRTISLSYDGNFQTVIIVPIVDNLRSQTRGIALVTCRAIQRKYHTIDLRASLPHTRAEALATTIDVMRRTINGKAYCLSVDRQTTTRNHATRATNDLTHSDRIVDILGKRAVARHNIGQRAVAIRQSHTHKCRTCIGQQHLTTRRIAHRVEQSALAFGRESPDILFDFHYIRSLMNNKYMGFFRYRQH